MFLLEKLVQLSELFDTTVDHLLTGDVPTDRPLSNNRLLQRFRALAEFQAEDQDAVIRIIDALIVKHGIVGVMKPVEKRRAG